MKLGARRPLYKQRLARATAQGRQTNAGGTPGDVPGAEPKKQKFHPLQALQGIETGGVLTGKDLAQAARALTALEIRPQLHGYKQLANQLTNERETEAKGYGALGTRLQGGVGNVYKNIASSAANQLATQNALAGRLNQQSAEITQQGQSNLQQTQQGQLGDYEKALALRGAPGGGAAQQELANAAAQQQASQSAGSQASQQAALQQGQGYSGLLAAMAGSAQMQGGSAVAGIGRDIANRTGASNQKYDENIQTALGKLADVKATKGATFDKNLLDLRGNEQKFMLGKAAVQGEKAKLAQAAAEAKAGQGQQQFENALSLKELGLKQWEAHHPNAGSNEASEKRKELRHEAGEVKALIPGLVAELGNPPANEKQLNFFIGKLNSKASADPQIVRKVVKHWFTKRYKKLSKDPNGNSQGR